MGESGYHEPDGTLRRWGIRRARKFLRLQASEVSMARLANKSGGRGSAQLLPNVVTDVARETVLTGRGEERRFCGEAANDLVGELSHRHHVVEVAYRRVSQQLCHPCVELHVDPTFVRNESVDQAVGADEGVPLDVVGRGNRRQDARGLLPVVVPHENAESLAVPQARVLRVEA